GSNFWLKRVHPFYFAKRGHDQVQDGSEDFLNTGIRFHFTRQGYLNIAHGQGHEPWIGRRFRTGADVNIYSSVQIFRWLSINGGLLEPPVLSYANIISVSGRCNSNSFWFSVTP